MNKEPTIEKKSLKTFEVTAQFKIKYRGTPYGVIRKTRKERIDKLNNITNDIFFLKLFTLAPNMILIEETLPHYGEDFDELLAFFRYNEVVTPTINLCINEFLMILTELQTGVYSGAARAMRYILEIAVNACEFQCGGERLTIKDLIEKYHSIVIKPMRKKELMNLMMEYNAWVSFTERYRLYEQTKRIAPSFVERVNRLNSREVFREAPQLHVELKKAYENLSNYIHPSLSQIMEPKDGEPSFNSEDFDNMYNSYLTTFDAILFLYIKSISHFLDIKSANDFLKKIASSTSFSKQLSSKTSNLFLNLQYSKKLSEGIVWKLTD